MKQIKYGYLSILLLTLSLFTRAQQSAGSGRIEGKVVDSIGLTGLPEASISLRTASRKLLRIIKADSLGYFHFDSLANGQYRLEASYVGYLTKSTTLINGAESADTVFTSIGLTPVDSVSAVSVAARIPFLQQDPDKITLNIASSPIAATSNAYDALLRAPGMNDQNGHPQFRGKGDIQVLINGRPSSLQTDQIKSVLSNMPASQIEKIVVTPTPSSKYDGTAGTLVNIILSKNKDYGANYTLTAGVGSSHYLFANTGLTFNYRNRLMNIYGGYNFSHEKKYNDDVTHNQLGGYSVISHNHEINTHNNNSYNLGTDFALNSASTVGFIIRGYDNKRDKSAQDHAALIQTGQAIRSVVNSDGTADFSNPAFTIYYETTLDSAGNKLAVNGDYSNYNQQLADHFVTRYTDSQPDIYLQDVSPQNNNIYALSADFTHPAQKANWTFGLKTTFATTDNNILWQNKTLNEWHLDSAKTNHFIYKENISAAYIDYTRMIRRLRIQLGVRAEQTHTNGDQRTLHKKMEQDYFNLFPTLGLMFMKNANNIYSLNYKRSIFRFNYNYVNPFITYQNAYNYYQGNPQLKPMLFDKLSFGYTHNHILHLNLGFTHVSHMIALQYLQGADNTVIQSYGNLNYGDYLTLTATIQKQMGVWQTTLTGLGGYAHYVSTGAPANNSFMGLLQWQHHLLLKKGWHFEANIGYSAPMASGVTKIEALFNTGIGISKALFKQAGALKLSVTDLFNTAKPSIRYQQSGITTYTDIQNESRFIRLTFKYSFGNKRVKPKTKKISGISELLNRMGN